MTAGLTPRMAECLAAIRKLTVDGVPPTYAQIGEAIGLRSKSGVNRLLDGMRARGMVDFGHRARSIRIIERPSRQDLARLSHDDLRAVMNDAIDILNRRDDAAVQA